MTTSDFSQKLHEDLQQQIKITSNLCKPINLDPESCNKKLNAIKKLDDILIKVSRKELQNTDFEEIVICSLSLIYYFGMQLKINKSSKCRSWSWRRRFLRAEAVFQKVMNHILPEKTKQTVHYTLMFFCENSLWTYESFIAQVLEVLMYFSKGDTTLINMLLTDIHETILNDPKHRLRILYELLKSSYCEMSRENLLSFVIRLLDFYAGSMTIKKSHIKNLRKGLGLCIHRIVRRTENNERFTIIRIMLNWFSMAANMSFEHDLELSDILIYAAETYKIKSYSESLTDNVLADVLDKYVASNEPLHSLIGCHLLLKFLDRQKNAEHFVTPSIYYDFSQVKFKWQACDNGDKAFLKGHRDMLHQYLMAAVQNHCENCVSLKALYSVVCCIVLEVPCGLTAAMAACLMMSVQDYALNAKNLIPICRNWMHATVVSVMSLICFVHKAPTLYKYVSQIISHRAKEAPFLNPPILEYYDILESDVIWHKTNLFFEDWELRYGLWKHFRDAKHVSTTYSVRRKDLTSI